MNLPWLYLVLTTLAGVGQAQTTNTFPASGNVGIGTTNPQAILHIAGSNNVLRLDHFGILDNPNTWMTQNAYYDGFWHRLTDGSPVAGMYFDQSAGNINFVTDTIRTGTPSPTAIMTILNAGDVGIGTISPVYKLDVSGDIHTSDGIVFPDGTIQTTAYPASSGGGTAPLIVENNEVTINSGISSNGSGIKHVRTNASCTTDTYPGHTCTIVINWPGTGFADPNYTGTCNAKGASSGSFALLIPDSNKTTTSMTVVVENLTYPGMQVTVNGLNCVAIHD